jgi:aspartyl-tRNA(Asn)/glutamyl-tRNA(Gln) amidotransferase subunit A
MTTAADIVRTVQTGERQPIDVVDEHLEIAISVNEDLNAFTEIDSQGARAVALTRTPGALAGVPIAIKDLIDHEGHVTTAGSAFYRHQATKSATVVQRLEAAGAVIIGRTGLHEFAYGFSSENPWHGVVRNPWDLDLSPGGSSGGSAAAVASGAVPIAIGTDTGGSVRVPAAMCGIVGLKVTHGRIPLTGVFPLAESLDSVGPLARTVEDAARAYGVMRGQDASDPWSIDVDDDPSAFSELADLRFGIPMAWLEAVPTTKETLETFEGAVAAIQDLGATVVRIDAPELVPTLHLLTLASTEAAGVHRRWFTDPDRPYGADVEKRLAAAMEVTVAQHLAARRWQAGLKNAARAALSNVDVLLTPTVGHPRKTIGVDTIDVDGVATPYRAVLSGYSALVNQLGCPAIALPLLAEGIPPPSIQLIGRWWEERFLLDIGAELEKLGVVGTRRPTR